MKPRRRIQRAFLEWLGDNHERFAVPIRLGRRTDHLYEFSFVGVNGAVGGWAGDYSLGISANYENECYDLLLDLEVRPKRVVGGYICALCLPEERRLFTDRSAVWRDHLFEPLLAWVNGKLAKANWLLIEGEPSAWSAATIVTEPPSDDPSKSSEGWRVLLPLRAENPPTQP